MNLVAPGTISDIRRRHIDDSQQLAEYIPKNKTVIDLGSGAGFPAVVLAILGYKVIAVESIGKKCRFLEMLRSELELPNLTIINDRVENALKPLSRIKKISPGGRQDDKKQSLGNDRAGQIAVFSNKNHDDFVFTARAFAPLTRILDLTQKLDIDYVLLKGRGTEDELALAHRKHRFWADLYPSKTGDGHIIKLTMK